MKMGRPPIVRVATLALLLTSVAAMSASCSKEPPPPSATRSDATSSADPSELVDLSRSRLREFPPPDGREAELAFLANGAAELAFFARGGGELALEIRRDDAPAQSSSLALTNDAAKPTKIVLPGERTRALVVKFAAPAGATIERVLVRDTEPRLPSAKKLAGSLRARSFLLVACDALNAEHLHCYGAARETSPNIDALANEGVRFAMARSQTAWTVPSVATLMTGLEQERHAVRDVGQVLDASAATLAEAFRDAGFVTAAFVQNKLVTKETGLDRGFDVWQEYPGEARSSLMPAVKRFFETPRERPCFLYVHFLPPHAPYTPPAEFATKFGAADASMDGSVDALAQLNQQNPKPGDAKVKKLAALYDNNVAFGDHLVHELVQCASAQLGEKLALLFLSDHGEEFGQHGALGHNVHVYDELTHVPLILWAPGSQLASGSVVAAPVWIPDVMPSVAELFGLSLRGGERPGQSFVGLLEGSASDATRLMRMSARYDAQGNPMQRAMLFGSFKLVSPAGRRVTSLFDLARDPSETTDVSSDHPALAAALRFELAQWAAETLVTSGKRFKPDAQMQRAMKELGYADDDGGK